MLSVYNPGGELSDTPKTAFMILPGMVVDDITTFVQASPSTSTSPAQHGLTMKTWLMLAGASVLAYWFLFRKKP